MYDRQVASHTLTTNKFVLKVKITNGIFKKSNSHYHHHHHHLHRHRYYRRLGKYYGARKRRLNLARFFSLGLY